jgi:hypothetical protein
LDHILEERNRMNAKVKLYSRIGLLLACLAFAHVGHAGLMVVVDPFGPTNITLDQGASLGYGVSWSQTVGLSTWAIYIKGLDGDTNPGLDVSLRKGSTIDTSTPIVGPTVITQVSDLSPVLSGTDLVPGTYYFLVGVGAVSNVTWNAGGTVSTEQPGFTLDGVFDSQDGATFGPTIGDRPAFALEGTPEPGTFLLLGAGLVGVGMWHRRRAIPR